MKNKGFSLIEVLVAAVLLGGTVVVLCGLSAKSLAAIRLSQDCERAWDILDRQLVLIDKMGVEKFIQEDKNSGQIKDAVSNRQWRWKAQIKQLDITGLYDVSVSVEWDTAGRTKTIAAQTRLCSRQTEM